MTSFLAQTRRGSTNPELEPVEKEPNEDAAGAGAATSDGAERRNEARGVCRWGDRCVDEVNFVEAMFEEEGSALGVVRATGKGGWIDKDSAEIIGKACD